MTIRAVVVGLLGATFIAGFTYFNEPVAQTPETYLTGRTRYSIRALWG